ncbi:MAG TPA: globin [Phenylobacterium sp.]|nr:globin [Phenylobacterium sp.]
MNAAAITESLERVSERSSDPTPLVYARLFAENPEMEALFVRDTDGSVRGQMLYQVIESILDFAGPRAFGPNLMKTEIVNHENLGVPREVFATFFGTVRSTFREILGADWTPDMDAGWNELLREIDATVA